MRDWELFWFLPLHTVVSGLCECEYNAVNTNSSELGLANMSVFVFLVFRVHIIYFREKH